MIILNGYKTESHDSLPTYDSNKEILNCYITKKTLYLFRIDPERGQVER